MPWCAQRKRPSGGYALAGTRLHGVADREGSWIDLTRSPYPSPLLGRPGAPLAAFLPESAISLICRVRAAEGARSKEEAEEGEGSRVRCRHSGEGGSEPDKMPLGRPAARPQGRREARSSHRGRAAARCCCHRGASKCTGRHPAASEARTARSGRQGAERRREKEAAFCCCPLCFLCLLLSDDNQKLAFINAVHSKRNREGTSSNCSRRTKKATQQHQQRQHLC